MHDINVLQNITCCSLSNCLRAFHDSKKITNLHTRYIVTETNSRHGGKGEIQAFQVSPVLNSHEHKGWDDQVNQETP